MNHRRDTRAMLFRLCGILAFSVLCAPFGLRAAPVNLTYNLGVEPKTLDPHQATGVKEAHVILNIIEGLTRLDAKGQAVPAIAERWSMSDDATSFTFYLRPAKWNTGAPVTADDFVYAWRRAADPATAAQYADQLFFIQNAEDINTKKEKDLRKLGVVAVTSSALQVNLRDPAPFFPSVIAHYIFSPLPEEYVSKNPTWASKPETYLSNGPFLLQSWKANDKLVLAKNPGYYAAGTVKLDTITMTMIVNESTALLQFESGKVDLTENAPLPDQERLISQGKLSIEPYLGTYFISFNCRQKPFDDVRVRRAFSLALDRERIAKAVVRGGKKPARGLVPPGISMAGTDYRMATGDLFADNVTEARRLLAEAGYPGGQNFPRVKYLTNDLDLHRTVGQALQAMWRDALGVKVDLQVKEWKVYLEDKKRKNYQIGRYGWIGDYTDPITFLNILASNSGNNDMAYSSREYDDIVTKLRQAVDPAARLSLSQAAERHMMADMPVAPIYFYTLDVLQKPYVKGVVRNPVGYMYFGGASVEPH